jgi:hypothetical protein
MSSSPIVVVVKVHGAKVPRHLIVPTGHMQCLRQSNRFGIIHHDVVVVVVVGATVEAMVQHVQVGRYFVNGLGSSGPIRMTVGAVFEAGRVHVGKKV